MNIIFTINRFLHKLFLRKVHSDEDVKYLNEYDLRAIQFRLKAITDPNFYRLGVTANEDYFCKEMRKRIARRNLGFYVP